MIAIEMTDQPRHDALTNLPNRQLFADRVGVGAHLAPSQSHAVLVLRIGGLPDADGTRHRDLLLLEMAARLRRGMRPGDVVARSAPREFAIWLEHCDEVDATGAAARVRDDLVLPVETDGAMVFPEVSVGIALFPAHADTTVELLRLAQLAADDALRQGAAYAIYRPTTRRAGRAAARSASGPSAGRGNQKGVLP